MSQRQYSKEHHYAHQTQRSRGRVGGKNHWKFQLEGRGVWFMCSLQQFGCRAALRRLAWRATLLAWGMS